MTNTMRRKVIGLASLGLAYVVLAATLVAYDIGAFDREQVARPMTPSASSDSVEPGSPTIDPTGVCPVTGATGRIAAPPVPAEGDCCAAGAENAHADCGHDVSDSEACEQGD